MATLEELVVSLVAETSGLRAELSNATKATKDATGQMDKAIEEFTKNSSSNLSFFETSMATMTGFLASEAIQSVIHFAKEGVAFLADQLIEGGKAAIAQEAALTRLANSLALSGQYTESAQKSLEDYTDTMESLTGVEDHVIAKNLAVLSSMTKLSAEGLMKAQTAALDLSAAMGIDLETATRLVGKGIEGSTDAFKRYGIEIQAGSSKAENLANILKKLAEFQGSSAAQANTFEGAILRLKNEWGNLYEEIARSLTQNKVVVTMINVVKDLFHDLTEGVKETGGGFKEELTRGILDTINALATLGKTADVIFRILYGSIQGLKIGLDTIVGSVNWLADKLGIVADDDPFSSLKKTAEALDNTVNNQTALGKLADILDDVGVAGENAFTKANMALGATKPTVDTHKQKIGELSDEYKKYLQTVADGLASQNQTLSEQFSTQNELRQADLDGEMAQLTEHNKNKWDLLQADLNSRQEAQTIFYDQQRSDLETAHENGVISDQKYNDAKNALEQKRLVDEKKMSNNRVLLEQQEQAARTQGYLTFLDGISVLSQSSNKELAAIGKAAAISKATIDAYLAIQNALATVPFPANIAASIGIGTMAFANVSKIAGIGFAEGGTLAGAGARMDSVPANLMTGETVVTRDLTDKMNEFFSSPKESQGGGSIVIELSLREQLVEFIEAKIVERQRTNISLLGT